jgi:predicted secreted protein
MSLSLSLAVYMVFWWLTLFMVLPWGVNRVEAHELEPGEDPGAPSKPKLIIKFAVTTVISGVFFAIFFWVEQSGLVSFRYTPE